MYGFIILGAALFFNGFIITGPGDIGKEKCVPCESGGNSDDIWHESEVPENVVYSVDCDPRERPEYEITYQQQVTPEDVFLQV